MMEFKSIEESELEEIHRRQNGDCDYGLAEMLDNDTPWTPMTAEQVKEAISKNLKKDRTSIFSMWVENDFIGVGAWSSNWDTWGPWAHIIIWPEYRRKGHGTEAAKILLARSFRDNPAHALDTGVPEWNTAAIAFVKGLGFKEAGRVRLSNIKDGKYFDDLIFDILKTEYDGIYGIPDTPQAVSQ